jgi:hypothetical protein
MTGKTFSFRIDSGTPFNVTGGNCSNPITVAAGTHTVTETPATGTEVQNITVTPAGNLVSTAGNSATVTVTLDSGITHETLVRFFNQPQGGNTGLLKVCKVAGDPSLLGAGFSFTENNGPAFTVAAGTSAAPNCSNTTEYPVGTHVDIAELPTTNTFVSDITVSDNRGSNVSTSSGTVTATIGAGTTTVTYTNKVPPVPQTGYIEVCKLPGDSFVNGNFTFHITGLGGFTDTESVLTGQCTGPIKVPAGNVNVAETIRFPFLVQSFTTVPSDRLVTSNNTNGTATVSVPVSSSSANETLVNVVNVTQLGLVKVCKTLDANATALAGSTFTFDVTSAAGASTVQVVAGAAGTTACKFLPSGLPLGSSVTVTERPGADFALTGVSVSPAEADNGTSGGTARIKVVNGVSAAIFTNQAQGNLEICKKANDPSTAGVTFQFSVNGGAPINVKAGECSPTIVLPAGTATVQELLPGNFLLKSVSANDSRLLTSSTTNPARVSIVTGGVANETVVTFTDAVKTGNFKICKASSDPSLSQIAFPFSFNYTFWNVTYTGTANLKPGECSSLSPPIPVVDQNGAPVTVNVTEGPTAGTFIQSITFDGAGSLTSSNTTTGASSFVIGNGVSNLTYTNARTPLTQGG